MKADAHAEPTKKETQTMASGKRCDASNFLIKGIDAGAGPMILKSGEFTIRVEVTGWPKELGPERPNLSWSQCAEWWRRSVRTSPSSRARAMTRACWTCRPRKQVVCVSSALGVLFGWISFVGIGLVRGGVAEAHRKGHGS